MYFAAIMGAGGSGKTTLLNCISTIDTITSGHIFIKDQDFADFRRENLGLFSRFQPVESI